mmetsp:Transcript_14591/g.47175  ORF Transcript_14591/g.47175 Transcript_14591/m.47175 type:complete len:203 (+) Transcript_14591:98-706(+)
MYVEGRREGELLLSRFFWSDFKPDLVPSIFHKIGIRFKLIFRLEHRFSNAPRLYIFGFDSKCAGQVQDSTINCITAFLGFPGDSLEQLLCCCQRPRGKKAAIHDGQFYEGCVKLLCNMRACSGIRRKEAARNGGQGQTSSSWRINGSSVERSQECISSDANLADVPGTARSGSNGREGRDEVASKGFVFVRSDAICSDSFRY